MANRGQPFEVNEAREIGTKNPKADNQEQASKLANQAIAYGREKAFVVSD